MPGIQPCVGVSGPANKQTPSVKKFLAILALCSLAFGSGAGNSAPHSSLGSTRAIPPDALRIINQDIYQDATWALRAVDTATGDVIYDLNSNQPLLIGSVRKLYSVGAALCTLGSAHTFVTDVHRQGTVDNSAEEETQAASAGGNKSENL